MYGPGGAAAAFQRHQHGPSEIYAVYENAQVRMCAESLRDGSRGACRWSGEPRGDSVRSSPVAAALQVSHITPGALHGDPRIVWRMSSAYELCA